MKYRLLKTKTIKKHGRTLYQIKAIKDFGNVLKGDVGGFIESEKNLSQEDNCWVYKNGIVLVEGKVVRGGEFEKSTLQIQGSNHFVNISSPNHITIGCHTHTFEEWKENFISIGKKEGYSKDQIKEYKSYIDMCISFPNQPKEAISTN